MAGVSGIFNIGRSALFSNKKALEVTSQNIANVNTPGYSRQETIFGTTPPENGNPGQVGTGVNIREVRRLIDRFVEQQITSGESKLGRLQTEEKLFRRIEGTLSDAQGNGINQAFNDFFAALNDVSNNPEDYSARVALIEKSTGLAQRISVTDRQFQEIRGDINAEVVSVIDEVNLLVGQITSLNSEVKRAQFAGQNANDLRDERQSLINELAAKIDIQTIEESNGQTTIFVGGGKALVEGELGGSLRGVASTDNKGFVNVSFVSANGAVTDINSMLANGKLQGLVNLRDTVLPGFIDSLDQLVAGTINDINQIHFTGFGLDGSTGNNFFSPLSPSATGLSANTGSAVVSVTVSTAASLTLDSYDLSFAGGNVTLTNLDSGAATTVAYSDPTTLTFEGLDVAISGAPAVGDLFRVSAHRGSAGGMSVLQSDPNRIAASSTAAGTPGNNNNALLLAAIQDKTITALGGVTLQGFYSTLTGDIGAKSATAQRSAAIEISLKAQLSQLREETSGVSLDEEMSNIIKFQRAFEASARIISMADELSQTILGMLR